MDFVLDILLALLAVVAVTLICGIPMLVVWAVLACAGAFRGPRD